MNISLMAFNILQEASCVDVATVDMVESIEELNVADGCTASCMEDTINYQADKLSVLFVQVQEFIVNFVITNKHYNSTR